MADHDYRDRLERMVAALAGGDWACSIDAAITDSDQIVLKASQYLTAIDAHLAEREAANAETFSTSTVRVVDPSTMDCPMPPEHGYGESDPPLQDAWVVIANASDWDNPDRAEWKAAAERWRDQYLHGQRPTGPSEEDDKPGIPARLVCKDPATPHPDWEGPSEQDREDAALLRSYLAYQTLSVKASRDLGAIADRRDPPKESPDAR